MPLKGTKKRTDNKKYYFENKDIISTHKKEAYYEDLHKNHEEIATHSKINYDKHPDSGTKSTARSKVNLTSRQWHQVNCQIQGKLH